MRLSSPLRYPGGKSAMAGLLREIRRLNYLGGYALAEPFAGGAGASLALLYLEETKQIFINDADTSIYDFWWSLTNRPTQFLDYLSNAEITIDEWRHQHDVYKRSCRASRIQRGFATFFLNRCNHSGIVVTGGPIGGINQTGKWKIDARFNKPNLLSRCNKVVEYRDRISVSNKDGIDFLSSADIQTTMFFIDPPYFEKGATLYLDSLEHQDHRSLAKRLKEMKNDVWILTYDDCPEIREIYSSWANIQPYSLRYTAQTRRYGAEILITPKWLRLPELQNSTGLKW